MVFAIQPNPLASPPLNWISAQLDLPFLCSDPDAGLNSRSAHDHGIVSRFGGYIPVGNRA